MMDRNSDEQIKIRKYENTMIVVGTGIILFAVWTMVKSIGVLLINRKAELSAIRAESLKETVNYSDAKLLGIFVFIAAVYLIGGVLIRLVIGMSAIAEGRGRHSGVIYIPITVFYILHSLFTIIAELAFIITGDNVLGLDAGSLSRVSFASVIIEFTSMVMMAEMVRSAMKLKKYRRRLKRMNTEAGHAA